MLKGRTPLFIALALSVLAGVLAFSALKKRELDVRRGWNLKPVVVANQDIPAGSVVTMDMVAINQIPEQFVTASVVNDAAVNYILNQKTLVSLQKGDPLLWSQFETLREADRLSPKVQKKTRAITIEAGKLTAVGGWVRPNDHVDVIGSFRDPNSNEQVAVTLLQNVIVLATGKITGTTNVHLIPEAQRDYTHISLLVIPEEAEILALAGELGRLTLSLRNEGDVDLMEERGRATIHTLLSGERTRAYQEKRAQIIQIIRGSGTEKAPVAAGSEKK